MKLSIFTPLKPATTVEKLKQTFLKTSLSVFVFLSLCGGHASAQVIPDTGSVDQQMEYVIEESNNYQQYKVIPATWMKELRSRVNDSIVDLKQEIQSLEQQIKSENAEMETMRGDMSAVRDSLATTRSMRDSMSFLGFRMSKSSYSAVVWSIAGVLFLLLIIFIIRFNHSNAVTVRTRDSLATLQEEYDQHRKRSLEREQKLRRELQDEINKQNRS